MLKRNPKFIYFDAGNVLVYKVTTEGENISSELGFDANEYEDIISKVVKTQPKEESQSFWEIRTLEDETKVLNKFHRRMCDYLKITHDDSLISKLTRYRTHGDFALKDGVVELLEQLSSKYDLGVLSNALPSRRHHELKLGNIDKYFKQIVISWEEGVNKPDKEIYDIAIRKSGVNPKDILFVDDKVSYLKGAEAAGIDNLVLMKRKEESDEYPNINKLSDLVKILEI